MTFNKTAMWTLCSYRFRRKLPTAHPPGPLVRGELQERRLTRESLRSYWRRSTGRRVMVVGTTTTGPGRGDEPEGGMETLPQVWHRRGVEVNG